MRKHLFGLTALCATCLALGAQAQLHSGGTSSDSSTSPDSGLNKSSQDSSSKPSTWDRIKNLAATGRSSHQDIRASQLTSAEVKSSSGDTVGTISDVVINPNSGKVDFAVISLNDSSSDSSSSFSRSSETGTSSSGRTGTTSPASASSSSTSGGAKQVAVPWSLLHSADTGSSSTSSSSMAQQNFTYSGDISKLQSAPAFDPNTDMSQPGWLQSIFSYFGVNQGSATGGATSPGSSSSGSNRSYPEGNPSNNP